jgi:saccharopine dehydrogenase (NAD+, L-lysine-forming)
MRWLVYGANGYTGTLVARLAVAEGHTPLLAGRDGKAVRALAHELDLDHRAVPLTDPAALRRLLADVDAVAHCAGPFSATARPMVEACLDTGTHYLDITGETGVFELVYGRHDRAVAAGVVLLPGAGFDVVPTDCLAARLAAAMPDATSLDLAFLVGGGMSHGTLRTALEGIGSGGLRRVDGVLVRCAPGEPVREVPFPSGPATVAGVRWGDLVSAFRSTGIPTITTYTRLPGPAGLTRALGAPLRQAIRLGPVRAVVAAVARRAGPGPNAQTRAGTGCEVWAEVRGPSGAAASATLTGPNPYDLTADAVVRAVEQIGGVRPGAHTPSSAFGARFVEELAGVRVSG